MVFDFSTLDYVEAPMLLLKNLDGTVIQPLGYAYEVTAKLLYNEVSELHFKVPAYVDGVETPHYADLTSMRLVDWMGMGQFILVNPKTQSDGISEYKECTAYSLEHELNYKQIYMEEGTYDFWNPIAQENTVLGIIISLLPLWSIGEVDEALWGKYRTFGVDNESVYDFIKNTAQETYQCVFDFDTYNRRINVRSVASDVATDPVFLSLDNLVQELEITEDTDNIFTCLDVNGADGVDIRSVNPLGTNKIYNLDYFMGHNYFTDEMVQKWNSWKTTYEDNQPLYYNTTIEKVLQEARLEAEKATLTKLKSELSQYTTLQSTYIEAAAQGIDRTSELKEIKQKIADAEDAIEDKNALLETIMNNIDALLNQQKSINQTCSFSAFFTDAEQKLLGLHIKESAISEDSFVYQQVSSYTAEDIAKTSQQVSGTFSGGTVTRVKNTANKEIYSIRGGSVDLTVDDGKIAAKVVRGALECKEDGSYVATAYLNAGTYGELSFPSGCISLTGTGCKLSSDVKADPDISGSYKEGTEVSVASGASNLYFTINATEYAKRSVEWDLMEFGQEQLREMSYPSYTFSLNSSNFLALDEFLAFKNNFHLGRKVYLEMPDGSVLAPIVIGAEIEMDDPSKLTLVFCDTYSASDEAMKLVNILGESVTVSKTTAANRFNYSAFVDTGASTSVRDFMQSAIDYSKNKILSADGQGITMDNSGITLKKANASGTGFDPEQIKMINNSIVFTRDNWSTVQMAIGKFHDENAGDVWGVVAPAIVGTLLAGSNLVIESSKKDGGVSVFRVDADGARLYNSRFDLVNEYSAGSSGQISLIPNIGFVGGKTTSTTPLFAFDEIGNPTGLKTVGGNTITSAANIKEDDLPNANFYVDMDGNAYFKGTVIATDGKFTGTVIAKDGSFTGAVNAKDLQLDGTSISNIFKAQPDEQGDLDYLQIGSITIDGKTGSISFNGSTEIVQVQYALSASGPWQDEWNNSWTNRVVYARYSYDGGATWGSAIQIQSVNGQDGDDGSDANVPSYIQATYIAKTEIKSPTITGNDICALRAFTVGDLDDPNGFMGIAKGRTIIDDGWGTSTATTYGVAMSAGSSLSSGVITFDSTGNYVIATDSGVRMTYNDGANRHELTVTKNGCFADGKAIGTGVGGNVVAVWGS